MKTIKPSELQKLLASEPSLPVLDVRTPAEFAEVHVPQARNQPLDKLQPMNLFEAGFFTKGSPVYILCRSGGRAAKAAELFARDGFHNGVVVEGGTMAWCDEGLPLNRGSIKTISLERQVRIAAGSIVLLGTMLAWLVHPEFIAISAFVGAGLIYGITDWCGMGLLLAKMPWNQNAASATSC